MPSASPLHDIRDRIGAGEVFAGGTRASVPAPGHSRRDRSLSLMLGGSNRVIWHCFSETPDPRRINDYLGISQGSAEYADRAAWEAQRRARERAEAERRARDNAFCEGVWRGGVPIAGSPAERYLASRGLTGPFTADLRFHPAAPRAKPRPPGEPPPPAPHPAMIAVVRDRLGTATGMHATYLKPDGSGKAFSAARSRLMFGACSGGAVRLAPVGPDGVLGIAEGIETALSLSLLGGPPTWAALSTSGIRGFQLPRGLSKLVVGPDGDDAGRAAAVALAERARDRVDVQVMAPAVGQDWNDVLTGGRGG